MRRRRVDSWFCAKRQQTYRRLFYCHILHGTRLIIAFVADNDKIYRSKVSIICSVLLCFKGGTSVAVLPSTTSSNCCLCGCCILLFRSYYQTRSSTTAEIARVGRNYAVQGCPRSLILYLSHKCYGRRKIISSPAKSCDFRFLFDIVGFHGDLSLRGHIS